MAKISEMPCLKCKELIPLKATRCSFCGHELSDIELTVRENVNKPIAPTLLGCAAMIAAVVGIGYLVVGFFSGSPETDPAPGGYDRAADMVWIAENQKLVRRALKDPDSAQFGDGDFVSRKSGQPMVCGTVNARNSFGGYTGASRYVVGGEPFGPFIDDGSADFQTVWNQLC